jgi:uncharacterized glyoxalase superfamily protein PhnB
MQISIIKPGALSELDPAISVEVDDVDAAYAAALANGAHIVYALTDEPWGVRRFFVRDQNGTILNVLVDER